MPYTKDLKHRIFKEYEIEMGSREYHNISRYFRIQAGLPLAWALDALDLDKNVPWTAAEIRPELFGTFTPAEEALYRAHLQLAENITVPDNDEITATYLEYLRRRGVGYEKLLAALPASYRPLPTE